jgi:uncharacterized Zn finger protein (UPF0148 family)
MEDELKPCPFCGHPKLRVMGKTEISDNKKDIFAYEYVPDTGFGGDYEEKIPMFDFRYTFYVRCNKCGERGALRKTPWHERTEAEAEDWTRADKYFGFEKTSEWARPAKDAAIEAWNTRAKVVDDD